MSDRDRVQVSVEEWLANSSVDIKIITERSNIDLGTFKASVRKLAANGQLTVFKTRRTGPGWPSGFAFEARFKVKDVTTLTPDELAAIQAVEVASSEIEHNGRIDPLEMSGLVRVEAPEGDTLVLARVAQRLITQGVVKHERNRFIATSKEEVLRGVDAYSLCDFCGASGSLHVIHAPSQTTQVGIDFHGNWAACEACYALISANKRAELLQRAIDENKAGKFGAASIRALLDSFWRARDTLTDAAGIGAALLDFIDDKLTESQPVAGMREKDQRVDAVKQLVGLTDDELDALRRHDVTYGQVAAKLEKWKRSFGSKENERKALEILGRPRPTLPPGQVPHWQAALDGKFSALNVLQRVAAAGDDSPVMFPQGTNLSDRDGVLDLIKRAELVRKVKEVNVTEDLKLLKGAEVYSFNAETIAAVSQAAQSIPHDSPLSSIQTPNTGAGFFWFGEPLPLPSASFASDYTAALLWGWTANPGGGPLIHFSTFVRDESSSHLKGQIVAATQWDWPLEATYDEMLATNREEWRDHYALGAPHHGELDEDSQVAEANYMRVISELSLFFLMACVWFKQRVPILVQEPGHIERHARKRLMKEHKLKDPPTVRVIALRKSLRESRPPKEGETTAPGAPREWSCRWVVEGHPRLQACGPKRADRKLIWITGFVKGPADKPLKVRDKVFAVIR